MNSQEPAKSPTQNSISEFILHTVAHLPGLGSKLLFPLNWAYQRMPTAGPARNNNAVILACLGRGTSAPTGIGITQQ